MTAQAIEVLGMLSSGCFVCLAPVEVLGGEDVVGRILVFRGRIPSQLVPLRAERSSAMAFGTPCTACTDSDLEFPPSSPGQPVFPLPAILLVRFGPPAVRAVRTVVWRAVVDNTKMHAAQRIYDYVLSAMPMPLALQVPLKQPHRWFLLHNLSACSVPGPASRRTSSVEGVGVFVVPPVRDFLC